MAPIPGISVATLVVFIILVHPITYCVWKHGKRGLLGWLVFQLFCMVRIVGSILQIQEAASNSTSDTAALILSNIGLSPLLLGSLGVLHEARTARDPDLNTRQEWRKVLVYHVAVIASMVLVIIGIVHEISTKTTTPPVIVKVGVIGLLLCWVTFCLWTIISLNQRTQDIMAVPAWGAATTARSIKAIDKTDVRRRTARDPDLNTRQEWRKVLVYHVAVIASMVLVIIGIVHEISTKTTTPPVIVKVGVIGLLLCWVTFCLWTIISLNQRTQDIMAVPAWGAATTLLYTVHAILPFLGCRVIYAVLSTFIEGPNFQNSTAAKVVLSTVPEMVVIWLMSVQGIRTRNIAALRKMEGERHSFPTHHSRGLQLEHKNYAMVTQSVE